MIALTDVGLVLEQTLCRALVRKSDCFIARLCAVARLKGDWAADIKAYDNAHNQILKMADMLSADIIKQFPKKFVVSSVFLELTMNPVDLTTGFTAFRRNL